MKYRDQLGQDIELKKRPRRIISLVPSQTELLYDLGIIPIAQTIFCTQPTEESRQAIKIGGTKKLNIDKIRGLKPDLIIGNKEENEQVEIESLQKDFPVWMSDIYSLEDVLEMIDVLGEILELKDKSRTICNTIKDEFNSLSLLPASGKKVLYLIWRQPYMAAGKMTFINTMLEYTGLKNVISDPESRYPEINPLDLLHLNPQLIFLSSEPFPFKQHHIAELQSILPEARIEMVDGTFYSWYGSRLIRSAAYMAGWRRRL